MAIDISKITIPTHAGVYIMKDDTGKIIYIGKAKNLRNRVRSYFLKNQNYKTQKLVEKISDIEVVLTDNESEAFLLEANMIKRYRPIYNIELKDQQRYTYLKITNEIHETIHRLENLQTRQKMESTKNYDEEYFGIIIQDQTAHLMSFRQTNGVIRDRNRFSFDLVGDNSFPSFLSQYYSTNPIPKFIVTSELPEKKDILEEVFSRTSGFKVNIIVPSSGKKKEMIKLIMKNLTLYQTKGPEPALVELQEKIGLKNIPKIIECFDISNHGADYAVGSMSRFIDGRPDKPGYRKFKIKTVQGRDDYAMINEVIKRRYIRLRKEKDETPDLILIDGGKGQLHAALDALKNIGSEIPCISLAKENEEVYIPKIKEPLVISKSNQALKILQHARDEAHRFGVAYNRSLRKFD